MLGHIVITGNRKRTELFNIFSACLLRRVDTRMKCSCNCLILQVARKSRFFSEYELIYHIFFAILGERQQLYLALGITGCFQPLSRVQQKTKHSFIKSFNRLCSVKEGKKFWCNTAQVGQGKSDCESQFNSGIMKHFN